MRKRKLLFCTHKVNRANIRRENRKGVEHIILTSFTLPPDIVMNGGLYSVEERDKTFETLNRTPVTIEHPEIDAIFVSANDPELDFEGFRFGAFNENARITDDNRIALDKVINVQKALMTEKGKRLLDRIEEIETNEKARPIHTSVGVYLDIEELDEPRTNKRGQEYTWLAKNMIFDHDAILLDSVGASTPDQGTGIGVNKENIKVEHYNCNIKKKKSSIPKKFQEKAKELHSNNTTTFSEIFEALDQLINADLDRDEHRNWLRHDSVDFDSFVFETPTGELFKSNYTVDKLGNIAIQDTRLPVERVVEYKTINKPTTEDDAMRDQILAELAKLGIKVNAEISDADLMKKYDEAKLAANKKADDENDASDDKTDIASVVANAVKAAVVPLTEQLSNLETKLTANSDKELKELATLVANSKKSLGLKEADLISLGLETVKTMAANCGVSHSIGSTMQVNDDDDAAFKTNVEDLPD